jgi:hypothetical protein
LKLGAFNLIVDTKEPTMSQVIARSWEKDGWLEKDWEDLTEEARDLLVITGAFDNAIGGGGGGFNPKRLIFYIERLESISTSLKHISGSYL